MHLVTTELCYLSVELSETKILSNSYIKLQTLEQRCQIININISAQSPLLHTLIIN